jgi:hypothetical protein
MRNLLYLRSISRCTGRTAPNDAMNAGVELKRARKETVAAYLKYYRRSFMEELSKTSKRD